jgi:hypothetical protein
MKFILAMYVDEAIWEKMSPEQMSAFGERIDAFNQALRDNGAWISAEGLDGRHTAKTLRFEAAGTPVTTDGPFSDAREQLGGFWVIDCADADEAVRWAAKAPMETGAIEVRPLVE